MKDYNTQKNPANMWFRNENVLHCFKCFVSSILKQSNLFFFLGQGQKSFAFKWFTKTPLRKKQRRGLWQRKSPGENVLATEQGFPNKWTCVAREAGQRQVLLDEKNCFRCQNKHSFFFTSIFYFKIMGLFMLPSHYTHPLLCFLVVKLLSI